VGQLSLRKDLEAELLVDIPVRLQQVLALLKISKDS